MVNGSSPQGIKSHYISIVDIVSNQQSVVTIYDTFEFRGEREICWRM